ncbi:3-dehydroquinate synthase [Evansella halocellulosilytica]|uniref:3-dehydroquinate synthase n=1 Tax=Evansella halocellulosilytica TaxID=2011013 RepID=UPI000BB803F1|nr:3-dehydroquinate synthase [Evansella halocellulosilytica]
MIDPKLTVETSQHQYPILVHEGIRFHAEEYILKYVNEKPSKVLIITDSHVKNYYLKDVLSSFLSQDRVFTFVIPSGEQSKSFTMYEELLTYALKKGLDRKSLIIALGGGVVGDIAGFVAATYMRGIPFIQMPTTLLAHDSSVGGKVGINHELGKNMVGSFHPPSLVLYDPECLLSLPEREWRSGFAEVLKHGFISDSSFLNWLQENVTTLHSWDMELLTNMLVDSISVKTKVVEEDEKERGIRAYLNFGHTLGHAIEAELGYGKITHGEAVIIGMLFALELSEKYYEVSLHVDSFKDYLKQLNYDFEIPENIETNKLMERMKRDKKSVYSTVRFVLLKDLGVPSLVEVDENAIYSLLNRKENEH